MRKITLFSVLFLLMGWVNAWAQTLVSSVDELTNGTVVALQCRDTNGGPNWYFNGNAVKTENLSYSNLYKVRTTESGFALQRLLDGTYVGKDGNNQAVKATLADAAVFTASIETATDWTTVVEGTVNGTSTIRFTTDGTYLNTKDKVTVPAYATETGGYSVWYVYTFTAEQAAAMQPYHRFESPRGGYLNANGESGNLQHIANNKEASLWKIDLIDGQDGVKLSNASLPNLYLATTSSFTAEGATWYVLDNPYRTGYKCISLTSNLSANCIDASNAGPGTGTWQPSSGDNEGTSWAISTYNPLSDLQNLVNSVENACGTDPGFIVQTAEITSAVATAKALIESGSSDMEQLDASITALEGILNTASRVMPEAGKLYMIVCAYPEYEAQQSVKKVMYSDGTNLKWGNLNELDRTQYWLIAPTDGGYTLQNYSDDKYIQTQTVQSANFTMAETAATGTLTLLNVAGQFNIKMGGYAAHTGAHGNGAGVSGNIVGWDGIANTASSWYIKEVEEPAGEVLTGVTINYTVNGTIMKTVTDATFDTNNPTSPVDFVTVGVPTIDKESTPVTVTLPCTYDLPFTASASYETATWYTLDMHSNDSGTGDILDGTNRYIWTFVAENEDVQLPKVASTEVDAGYIPDNRKWAFVGDPFNGFKIYNKAAGSTLTLRKAEDGNNAAVMSATDDRNVFMLHHTTQNIENSFAWKIEGDSYYINTQAVNNVKVLRGWTAADGGSSCRVFASLTDIPTGTFYRFKGVANERYLTTGNIGSRLPLVEDGTGAESIFYFDNERKLWNYASGLSIANTHSTAGVNDAANTWEIMDNGNDQYILKANAVGGNGRYLYNHNTSDAANVGLANRNSILAGNNTLWVIEPVTELPVSVSEAGYATLFAPKALNIPTDMEAYSGAVNTEKSALEMTAVEGIIPANTPVVLKAAAGNYTFTIATEEGTAVESNDLLGVVRRTATPADTYTLQNQNGNVGFYPYNGENINGFKAYISLPADAGVNGLSFSFGDATGIESISAAEADNSKSTEIYDLAGRRVSKPTKGLYIIGGKKVIVK